MSQQGFGMNLASPGILLEMSTGKNIFLKTAFYRTTEDKYIAGQTSRTKPVEVAFCRDKQRRRISVRVHFLGCRSA
jgi:hypothetical protein